MAFLLKHSLELVFITHLSLKAVRDLDRDGRQDHVSALTVVLLNSEECILCFIHLTTQADLDQPYLCLPLCYNKYITCSLNYRLSNE